MLAVEQKLVFLRFEQFVFNKDIIDNQIMFRMRVSTKQRSCFQLAATFVPPGF